MAVESLVLADDSVFGARGEEGGVKFFSLVFCKSSGWLWRQMGLGGVNLFPHPLRGLHWLSVL